jgi:hypothetical protein
MKGDPKQNQIASKVCQKIAQDEKQGHTPLLLLSQCEARS